MASPRSSMTTSAGVQIARLFGIPLIIHGSWVISLGILSLVASQAIIPDIAPAAPPAVTLVLSLMFGVVIAACIVVHELAHCLVARGYRLPVRRITLFAFGGVSQIEREAPGPAAEFHIAVAGPLASLTIAGVFGVIARVLDPQTQALVGPWGGVAFINLALAIFNLMPAFPMDGGRILRSGLWGAVRDRARATRWAVVVGHMFAGGLIALGVVSIVLSYVREEAGDPLGSAWTIFIGFYIYQAASSAGSTEGADEPNRTPFQPPPMRGPR